MSEEPVLPTATVDTTCHTEGCVNNGVTHRIEAPINADNVFRVWCGTCNRPVADIVPVD